MWAVLLTGVAAPAQLISVDAFRREQKALEDAVEKKLNRKFSSERAHIEKLKEPHRIGGQVSVSLVRGQHRELVSGRFNGIISGRYAKIGRSKVLLDDLNISERDRLSWNNVQEALDKIIDKRQAELNKKGDAQRHSILQEAYAGRGYGTEFVRRNVVLDTMIGKRRIFGEGSVSMVVQFEEGEDLARIAIQVGSPKALDYVVLCNELPLAVRINKRTNRTARNRKVTYWVESTDLGDNIANEFADLVRIVCHHPDIGTWELRPHAKVKRQAKTVQKAGQPVRVVRVQGRFILGVEPYPLEISKVPVLSYEEFLEISESAAKYMGDIKADSDVAAPVPVPAAQDVDGAGEVDENGDVIAINADVETNLPSGGIVEIIQTLASEALPYEWSDPQIMPYRTLSKVAFTRQYPMNRPDPVRKLGVETVLRTSQWQSVKEVERNVFDMSQSISKVKTRLLITRSDDRELGYYFQYRGTFTNLKTFSQTVISKLLLKADDEAHSFTSTLRVEPKWSGKVYIAQKVPFDLIENPIDSVAVSVLE